MTYVFTVWSLLWGLCLTCFIFHISTFFFLYVLFFVSKCTEQNSLTLFSNKSWKSMYHETVKKHRHTLSGNYNSCITTIYGNNCRLQELYDNAISVSGELSQYWTTKSMLRFASLLKIMYNDMHHRTSAPTVCCYLDVVSHKWS